MKKEKLSELKTLRDNLSVKLAVKQNIRLIEAVIDGNLEAVQLHLSKGATLDATDDKGNGLTILFTCFEHKEIAEYLLPLMTEEQINKRNHSNNDWSWFDEMYGYGEVVMNMVRARLDQIMLNKVIAPVKPRSRSLSL